MRVRAVRTGGATKRMPDAAMYRVAFASEKRGFANILYTEGGQETDSYVNLVGLGYLSFPSW